METIALNISFLTARNGVKWTKAKVMSAYMLGRKKKYIYTELKL